MSKSEKGGTNSQREMKSAKSRRNGRRRKRLKNEIEMLMRRTGQQQRRDKWGMENRSRSLHRG